MPSVRLIAGQTGVATATNRTALNATDAVTVAFWSRRSTTLSATIFRQASTANSARDGYSIGFQAGGSLAMFVNGSAGQTSVGAGLGGVHKDGQWTHYAVTFDDASNAFRAYTNGKLFGVNTNTRDMTANASCTTAIAGGDYAQNDLELFDLQILPNIVVPAGDMPLLMDPRYVYQGVQARYFGLEFSQVTAGEILYDETGNGNNLTVAATRTLWSDEEPPFRPTLA